MIIQTFPSENVYGAFWLTCGYNPNSYHNFLSNIYNNKPNNSHIITKKTKQQLPYYNIYNKKENFSPGW